MNAQDFTNLYTKQDRDEAVTAFQNEAGFSLIRTYPKDTLYYKDGRRMFIKVAVLDRGFFYGIDMTKPEKRGVREDHIITEGKEYKKKITNFFSDADNSEFFFDEKAKKIKHVKTQRDLTLNEFINILEKNHLSDLLFWKRGMNKLVSIVLKILFWFVNKHYDNVQASLDKYNFSRDNKPIIEEKDSVEPFFKYFYISKNLIFTILLLSFFIAILTVIFPFKISLEYIWYSLFGHFSLSNPMVVLFFFLILFSSEKLSMWLNKRIKEFLMPDQSMFSENEENFIEKLHNYQHHNKFNLKL